MSQGPIHHGDRRGLSVRGMQCGDAGPNVFLSKARLCLDFPLSESPSSRRFLISPEKAVRSDGQALSGAAQKEALAGRDSPRTRTCTTLGGSGTTWRKKQGAPSWGPKRKREACGSHSEVLLSPPPRCPWPLEGAATCSEQRAPSFRARGPASEPARGLLPRLGRERARSFRWRILGESGGRLEQRPESSSKILH